MLISMACYIVMAVSLNLVVGLLGELSLGHAGFMSVGLFTGCLLSIQLAQSVHIGVRMPLSMLLGGVAAAVVGLLVGLPALRLKGDYLAIVTLACARSSRPSSTISPSPAAPRGWIPAISTPIPGHCCPLPSC